MKTLVSMTNFVLQDWSKYKGYDSEDYRVFAYNKTVILENYAQFLKKPLTLQMFFPSDEEGRIWEAPKTCCSGRECGCMGQPVNYYSSEEIDKYYELESKVLFKGFSLDIKELSNNRKLIYITYSGKIILNGNNLKSFTIEDILNIEEELVFELTESAIKQIGYEKP